MGKIRVIDQGTGVRSDDCTATSAEVLLGYKTLLVESDDEIGVGTMPNHGAVTANLNCSGSYTIPLGYHNGKGVITANSLASQTSANAAAAQILTGYNAWVNGTKINGSMANRGAVTKALNCGGSYTIPAGYHNGSGKVTANSLYDQTRANATAARILNGFTAWVDGSKITGNVVAHNALSFNVAASGNSITCTYKHPNAASGKGYTGVEIRYQTGSSPGTTGGIMSRIDHSSGNTAPGTSKVTGGSTAQAIFSNLSYSTTYYFTCRAYFRYTINGTDTIIYGSTVFSGSCTTSAPPCGCNYNCGDCGNDCGDSCDSCMGDCGCDCDNDKCDTCCQGG